MNKTINTVVFEPNTFSATVKDTMYQWDTKQILRIEGLDLDPYVQVQFAIDKFGKTEDEIGKTENGITEVKIPQCVFEKYTMSDYEVRAYIYANETTHEIIMNIKTREKPQDYVAETSAISQALDILNSNNQLAESYAHGGTGSRVNEDIDNAKYFSDEAKRVSLEAEEKVNSIDSTVDQAKLDLNTVATQTKEDISKVATSAEAKINSKVSEVNKTANDVNIKAAQVATDKNTVAQDKASVNTMKNDVTAKATQVANDKQTVTQLKQEVEQGIQENMQYVGYWYTI